MKKKILFTTYDLNMGGIERSLVNLVNNFDLNKYDVTIILQKKEGYLLNELDERIIVKGYNLSKSRYKIIRKFINLFKIINVYFSNINKFDFSFCYGYGYKPSAVLALLASKNNAVWMHTNIVEFIRNQNDLNLPEQKVYKLVNKFLRKRKFKNFKKYLFVSQNALEAYAVLYPCEKEKLVLCHNYIDYKTIIKGSKTKVSDMYKKDKLTFINISRHTEYDKKLSRIINAIEKLNKSYDFKLIMIGDGKDNSLYKDMVNKKNLKDVVYFYGKKENPFPYLKNADALVMSSSFEGFPTTFFEAMVLNIPIITTDVSDSKDIIKDKYGLVVDNDDTSIYLGMKQFLDKKFIIKEKFNYKKYNDDSLKTIYDIINNER